MDFFLVYTNVNKCNTSQTLTFGWVVDRPNVDLYIIKNQLCLS